MFARKFSRVLAICSLFIVTNSAFATLITEEFNLRLRSFGNTGGQELYIGVGDLGQAANREASEYVWQQGDNAFVFTFDGVSVFELTLGNTSLSYTVNEDLSGKMLSALNLFVFSRDTASSVTLTSLGFDGVTPFATNLPGASWTPYTFEDLSVSGAFTMNGIINLDGGFSNSQERSKVEIKLGFVEASTATQVPNPSVWSLILLGLAMMTLRRK